MPLVLQSTLFLSPHATDMLAYLDDISILSLSLVTMLADLASTRRMILNKLRRTSLEQFAMSREDMQSGDMRFLDAVRARQLATKPSTWHCVLRAQRCTVSVVRVMFRDTVPKKENPST